MFIKYPHIERIGNTEVESIETGECYVFPKLDGTNASVWWDDGIQAGSRTRHLSEEKDNAGFFKEIKNNTQIYKFLNEFPGFRLFGEFLVPHTLKSYRDDAWRKFYVFDVFDDLGERFLTYDEYAPLLQGFGIEFIPCYKKINNGTFEDFYREAKSIKYLLKNQDDLGEGVVIKNYSYINKYGRYAIAKLVLEEFKEKFHANVELGGPPSVGSEKISEKTFLDNCMSRALVEKEFAKLALDGWESKKIGKLLDNVYQALIIEELGNELLRNRYETLNFGRLRQLTIMYIKQMKPEIF